MKTSSYGSAKPQPTRQSIPAPTLARCRSLHRACEPRARPAGLGGRIFLGQRAVA